MIILIAGSTHAGKTLFAQKLLEAYSYPYLSIDHLKMGLIRSGRTSLTPESDGRLLTDYLWPVLREIIKTAIENNQNLIVEGCYIPFTWRDSFTEEYLKSIRYYCIIMTDSYIDTHFQDIKKYANAIEAREEDSWITPEMLKEENGKNLQLCKKYDCTYLLVDNIYQVDVTLD